jgi:hypothetical protein
MNSVAKPIQPRKWNVTQPCTSGETLTATEEYGGVRAIGMKRALRVTLDNNTRPVTRLADAIGVSDTAVHMWADERIDNHIPGARIPGLLANSDDCTFISYLAALQDMAVVPLPKANGKRSDVCHLAAIASTFARLLHTHVEAVADGRWSAEEVAALKPIVGELVALSLGHLAYAEREANGAEVIDMPKRGER